MNKTTFYGLVVGCGTVLFFFAFVGMSFAALINPGAFKKNDDTSSTSGFTAGPGEEGVFVLTHYYPCTPEFMKVHKCNPKMEGDESMASGATAHYDESSPMGFYATYKDRRYDYVFAAVQSMHNPIVPTHYFAKHKGSDPETGVYFDDNTKVFLALDCFARSVSASNAMDIMASDTGYQKFIENLKKAGLYIDSNGNNGLSHGVTRAKGTVAQIIKAGTTGSIQ